MLSKLAQQISEKYPEVTIHNITECARDNDPRHSAAKLYELSCDDNNFIVIENFDYRKLYSIYTEFMRLKSGPVTEPMHKFITCDVFLMRGSPFVLINKYFPDDVIRNALKTLLVPRAKCVSCGLVLKVGIPRVRCGSCYVLYCTACSRYRWKDHFWCNCCSHHMIYNKIAKPIDDEHLERLNGILAAKMEHSVIINEDVLNSWKKAN